MTKTEFIEQVAARAAVSKAGAGRTFEAITDVIAASLKADGVLVLKGLGTFRRVLVAERRYDSPITGGPVVKPAHHRVKFKPGKDLVDASS